MNHDVLNINVQEITVLPAIVLFPEYESIKEQAMQLASNIAQLEVNEDNIKISKKMLAAVNNRLKEMDDRRIAIKKEVLESYVAFEQQVKEIVSIVKEADSTVREQIRELEEQEREQKRIAIEDIFEKRIKQYSFGEIFGFENFLKPAHLNKTVTIKSVESDMVEWLEKIDSDLAAINSLPNNEAVMTEYFDTKDVATAIRIVSEREALKNKIAHAIQTPKQDVQPAYQVTVFGDKNLLVLETFLQVKEIEYQIKRVGN